MQIQAIKMNFLEPIKQMGLLAMIFLALTVSAHFVCGQNSISDWLCCMNPAQKELDSFNKSNRK